MKTFVALTCFAFFFTSGSGQTTHQAPGFELALPNHNGQLQWRAEGFHVVESSAKPNGVEIGVRSRDDSGLTYLIFLFVVPGQQSLTSAKCRDSELGVARRDSVNFKIIDTSEIQRPADLPIALANYSAGKDKTWYSARAFVATSNICGDLEFYDQSPVSTSDPRVKRILDTFRLDPAYIPQFRDVFLYAQVLYKAQQYSAAAPIFQQALGMLHEGKDQITWIRVTTDQAGLAYGISGNIGKAREIFTSAIAKDPDYPLYYYNLACADAEQNKLADARLHLQQAFARKANIIPGESMPDPTKDDSFTPYRNNKHFWTFIESLH